MNNNRDFLTSPSTNRLNPKDLAHIDERSNSFAGDDILEGIPDPATDPLLQLTNQILSPVKMPAGTPNLQIPHYQREIIQDEEGSEESSMREKELSFYALDCENIDDVIR